MTNYELMLLDAEWWLLCDMGLEIEKGLSSKQMEKAMMMMVDYMNQGEIRARETDTVYSWFALLISEAEKGIE